MDPTDDFDELLTKVKLGNAEAMASLVATYEKEVRLVARLRLGASLRPHLDSVDIAQSVHRCLMVGLKDGRFDISTPDKLIALALVMVRRKVANQWRHLKRQQRLSVGGDAGGKTKDLLIDSQVTEDYVEEGVAVSETIERLLASLDATERKLIEMRQSGHTTAEIARNLGLDPDSLRVRLSRLRRRIRESGLMDDWL